jgi:hypothetical protein
MVGVSAASKAEHAALRPPQHQLSTEVALAAFEEVQGGSAMAGRGRACCPTGLRMHTYLAHLAKI